MKFIDNLVDKGKVRTAIFFLIIIGIITSPYFLLTGKFSKHKL